MTKVPDPSDIALLTKSYAGDFDLCRQLCASVDRHMPGITHYLVIDRADMVLFAPLAGPRRLLVETEHYLPLFRPLTLAGRRFWFSPYAPPVRGWIYQQMAKIAVTAALSEPAVVLVDSDVVFVRPLDPVRVLRDGRTRLYHAPGAASAGEHLKWHRAAARLLGLPDRGYFGADYISNGVTWRPSVAAALCARIAATTRLPWQMALAWRLRLSEYILYGVFADHVEGPHQAMLFHDDAELCHCSWHYDLGTEAGRAAFVSGMAPDQCAILIQSNLGLDGKHRADLLARFGAPVETAATS